MNNIYIVPIVYLVVVLVWIIYYKIKYSISKTNYSKTLEEIDYEDWRHKVLELKPHLVLKSISISNPNESLDETLKKIDNFFLGVEYEIGPIKKYSDSLRISILCEDLEEDEIKLRNKQAKRNSQLEELLKNNK